MAKDRLIVTNEYDRHVFHVAWLLADDGEVGGVLGQDSKDGTGAAPTDDADWEHWVASKAVREMTPRPARDSFGYFWESHRGAHEALRVAGEAIKRGRAAKPLPDWAQKAIAAGWKAPNGWQP
jgi:hypothetical protein